MIALERRPANTTTSDTPLPPGLPWPHRVCKAKYRFADRRGGWFCLYSHFGWKWPQHARQHWNAAQCCCCRRKYVSSKVSSTVRETARPQVELRILQGLNTGPSPGSVHHQPSPLLWCLSGGHTSNTAIPTSARKRELSVCTDQTSYGVKTPNVVQREGATHGVVFFSIVSSSFVSFVPPWMTSCGPILPAMWIIIIALLIWTRGKGTKEMDLHFALDPPLFWS